MSAQYDVLPGIDLSSYASATLAEITQAISQLGPLSNIAFVVYSATTPDVAGNPRFKRFIWSDCGVDGTVNQPVLKRWNEDSGVWELFGNAASSILTSMIAVASATGGVDLTRMKVNSAFTDSGYAGYLLRVNSAGTGFEVVSLASLLIANSVPLDSLSLTDVNRGSTGKNNCFLGFDNAGTNLAWRTMPSLAAGAITNTMLAGGITINKKSVSEASKFQYCQLDSTSAAFEYTDPVHVATWIKESTSRGTIAAAADSDNGGLASALDADALPLKAFDLAHMYEITDFASSITPNLSLSKFLFELSLDVRALGPWPQNIAAAITFDGTLVGIGRVALTLANTSSNLIVKGYYANTTAVAKTVKVKIGAGAVNDAFSWNGYGGFAYGSTLKARLILKEYAARFTAL